MQIAVGSKRFRIRSVSYCDFRKGVCLSMPLLIKGRQSQRCWESDKLRVEGVSGVGCC